MQLRQYLSGEALQVVEDLGHSANAYEAAKQRLDRKFGGKRRQLLVYLDEVEKLRPLREGCAADFDKFADILDIVVLNLKEAGKTDELGCGSLYLKLQRKIPEATLARYHRWICERNMTESVEVLRQWISQEAEFQTIAAETVHGVTGNKPQKTKQRNFYADSNKSEHSPVTLTCKVCGALHGVWKCEEFRKREVNDRWTLAKQHKLCFKCLGNHFGKDCIRKRICGIKGCKQDHNRLLHNFSRSRPTTNPGVNQPVSEGGASFAGDTATLGAGSAKEGDDYSRESRERVHTSTTTSINNRYVALRTVPVILTNGSKRLKVNALLDDGSTKTYINSDVAAELGLQGSLQKVVVNVLNGQTETFQTMPVEVGLESLSGETKMLISAFTTDKVTGDMQVIDWKSHAPRWPHLRQIRFPTVSRRPIVDLLIGVDHGDLHFSSQDVKGKKGEPIARCTPLGWTCIGTPEEDRNEYLQSNFIHTYHAQDCSLLEEINTNLKKLWEIDSVKEEKLAMSQDDKLALKRVESSLEYKGGHYSVAIPWKDHPDLPNNYEVAYKRLQNTEVKLLKNPELAQSYADVINRYVEQGYVKKVAPIDSEKQWFLPHFPVVKPDRSTTKIRIVFDASAKCQGISLNDAIHQGPKLQKELFDVLTRFRRYPVAITCDIAEMYLQIELPEEDRPFHRFLWRSLEKDRAPDVYEFTRVVFGVNCSPFQAQFVAQSHAESVQHLFPLASEAILKSTYMDDTMDSVKSEENGKELYQQLKAVWKSAGMCPRKWLSNSTAVLTTIPPEERASEVELEYENLPTVKTLGILWNASDDSFTFKPTKPSEDMKLTKRNFFSKISTLFDPLGFLSPYTIRAKVLMQETWTTGLDWDSPLDDELAKKIRKWFEELDDLPNISIPRCLQLCQEVVSFTIHTFVDASQDAYGAVVYARCAYSDGTVSRRIIASKAKVAPLATVSIPRLELMAAVLGLRLTSSVCEVMKMAITSVVFWSDSMNVLHWIRGRSRTYKPFIANRVGEIQTFTNPDQWRHVSTSENPADLLTRGVSPLCLMKNKLWWEGPDFLAKPDNEWPLKVWTPVNVEENLTCYCIDRQTSGQQEENLHRLDPGNFSSWTRLVRIQAWVHRFIHNVSGPREKRTSGELTVEEIKDSETRIIVLAQKEAFSEEYKELQKQKGLPKTSKLLSLQPQLDQDGVMRANGRLMYAEFLPYDVRFPVVLPRKHNVTRLIIKKHHEDGNHVSGTNHTLSSLSSRFFIQAAREAIREWEKECATCRRKKAKAASQVMAPLPVTRLGMSLSAFTHTAVDFGGPFITIQGRGKQRTKRYLCLFTCLATRAVHLEMAYGLDTDSFMNAFYRMTSRRGVPELVISDKGTNFVGAARELREWQEQLNTERIISATAHHGVRWKFNPPAAPHFGGAHETMIKAAKRAIYAILGNADVTDEMLNTAFIAAESLINSRPLTYQSSHPADNVPLTPNHFLHGRLGGDFAPRSVDDVDRCPQRRWRRVQELMRHYWKRWMQEWLPGLTPRKKWLHNQRNVKVGEIVLVINPETQKGHWPLGRILEVYPGKDGFVRVVKVLVGDTVLKRPVTKICKLELDT